MFGKIQTQRITRRRRMGRKQPWRDHEMKLLSFLAEALLSEMWILKQDNNHYRIQQTVWFHTQIKCLQCVKEITADNKLFLPLTKSTSIKSVFTFVIFRGTFSKFWNIALDKLYTTSFQIMTPTAEICKWRKCLNTQINAINFQDNEDQYENTYHKNGLFDRPLP